MLALALVLAAAPDAGAHPPSVFRTQPDRAPAEVKLPKDAHPLLSNPQVAIGGSKLYVARTGGPAGNALTLDVVPLTSNARPTTLTLSVPTEGAPVRLLLSANEKNLAVLSAGQLWIVALPFKDEGKPEENSPRRLYPPQEGDAPLGPKLTHAAFARDSSWILAQSPNGWARISIKDGSYGVLPMHPIDLGDGRLAFSPDGEHVMFVKTQTGVGFQNGGGAIAVNVNTNFAQVLDAEHTYIDVAFLPDGMPLGMETDGSLWILRPQARLPYFTPPKPKGGGVIDGYALDLGLTTLAWTVVKGEGANARAELWSATAPVPPKQKKQDP